MSRVLVIAGIAQSLINFRGELLKEISSLGNEVHVAAGDLYDCSEVAEELKHKGYEVHRIPLNRSSISPADDFRLFIALFDLIRNIAPDVVFAYTIKPVIWGMLAAAVNHVSSRIALVTGLGYAFTGKIAGKKWVVNKVACLLYEKALKNAQVVFFQNPDDLNEFKRLGVVHHKQNVVVVNGSGVCLERFRQEPFPDLPLRFLMIARLLGEKGVREYAKAAEMIRSQYPEVEFHLVGDVDENPDSVSLEEVSVWHKNHILVWHGKTDDVRPYIAACHVFVLPSFYREGMPRTIQESMAMGRPVITTDSPGCRETVTNGKNGILVPVKDVAALVQAMKTFIKNPELVEKMGSASREIAVAKYDVRKVNTVMLKEMGMQ